MSSARTSLVALGAAAAVAASGAASAGAATVDVGASSSSVTSIRLDATFTKGLRATGIRLTAGRPATLRGSTLRLPVSRTRTTASQTRLTHRGTLRLRTSKRSVALTSWRTTVKPSGLTMSAVVARKRRTVFSVKGGRIATDAATGRTTITGSTVRLTGAGASVLRARLKVTGLRAGVVGRATGTAAPAAPSPKPLPTPPATPAPAPTPSPAPTTPPTDPTPPVTPGPDVPTPACPTTAPAPFADGATWGVKASFRNYVLGPIAKGRISCGDGATGIGTGDAPSSFRFDVPTTSWFDPDTGAIDATYRGTVTFEGHDMGAGPLLGLRISDPHVVVAAGQTTGVLRADVESRSPDAAPDSPATSYPDIALADLDLAGVTPSVVGTDRVFTDVPMTLRAEAVEAFAGFYTAGTPLDPITFRVADSATPLRASAVEWSQLKLYDTSAPADTQRTWLGYATNAIGGPGAANGTMTPSGLATGPTVNGSSASGADSPYVTRFPAASSSYDARTGTGTLSLGGTLTFASTNHRFTITVVNPSVRFLDASTAQLYASGASGGGTSSTYDTSKPVFTLDLSKADSTDNGDGTKTLTGVVPSIATAGLVFPASPYAVGTGPNRTPNTFGSFAIRLPTSPAIPPADAGQ